MDFKPVDLNVRALVTSWQNNSLSRNPEYQRGAAWDLAQKQALIDSIFRRYPIPPLFVEAKRSEGMFGGATERHEIIDGQQRTLALDAFFRDEFELLKPDDKKLRLPHSLRAVPSPWAGRRYSQLDADLKARLDNTKMTMYLVENVDNPDEVRDLFIRLQSGTALTRQQIRDAWPGNIGPLVESLAGKLKRVPSFRVFGVIDGRGTRDEEDDPRDGYVQHRQTCAQLLRVMIARLSDPRHFPSVLADDIDGFYHEQTMIPVDGEMEREIRVVLTKAQIVTDALTERTTGKRKVPKLMVFSLVFFMQDMRTNPYFKLDPASANKLADYMANVSMASKGRAVSGPAIREYYEEWKRRLPEGIGILMDEKRFFDSEQKITIWNRDEGRCQVCGAPVEEVQAEYDHYPLPHYLGGRTKVENGRLVHQKCHPRGPAVYPQN